MSKQKKSKSTPLTGSKQSNNHKKSGVGSYSNREGAESSRGSGTGIRPTKKDKS